MTRLLHRHYSEWATGDGTKTVFFLAHTPSTDSELIVTVAGLVKRPSASGTTYDYALAGNKVTFAAAPAAAAHVGFHIASA